MAMLNIFLRCCIHLHSVPCRLWSVLVDGRWHPQADKDKNREVPPMQQLRWDTFPREAHD